MTCVNKMGCVCWHVPVISSHKVGEIFRVEVLVCPPKLLLLEAGGIFYMLKKKKKMKKDVILCSLLTPHLSKWCH